MADDNSLEARVRYVEKELSTHVAHFKSHVRETHGLREHITHIDREKITPMQKQVNEMHSAMSKREGFREGKDTAFVSTIKTLSVICAATGVLTTIIVMAV